MTTYTRDHARQFLQRQRIGVHAGHGFLNSAELMHLFRLKEWPIVGRIRKGRYAGAFTLVCMTRQYRDEAAAKIERSKGRLVMTWNGRRGRYWLMFTLPRQRWAVGERRSLRIGGVA